MSKGLTSRLKIGDLFICQKGNSKYTKKYCHEHKGDFEVYTGTTIGTFAKIDTYDYSIPQLTYTTDGENTGTVSIIYDKHYSVGGHRSILTPKNQLICIEFFEQVLENIFKGRVKSGSVPSLTWTRAKNIEVDVPIDENGNFDYDRQLELAQRYESLKQRKEYLIDRMNFLSDSYLFVPLNNIPQKRMCLNEIFTFKRGISCTKRFCMEHKGDYPVWSANNNTPIGYIDSYNYDGTYISLSRNGIAGKTKVLSGKFTINEDRFLLVPKCDNLDPEFICYILEPILRGRKKGRSGHDGQNEFTKLSFTILDDTFVEIPVDEFGNFNLEQQKVIANHYNMLYKVKNDICNRIHELVSINLVEQSKHNLN